MSEALERDGLVLLDPRNFTPLTRTPWAGDKLSRGIKRHLLSSPLPIGESWEFSCDPAFPSRLAASNRSLNEVVQSELLIKLLDAAEPLSLQVHPFDGDPNLRADECGKPEAWLILQADPGAGIYLGFSKPLQRNKLRELLHRGADLSSLLTFVPVKPGDYFEIAPGTPHAIGQGVLLLETQRVQAGKSGKTYRLWDWNRRYDSAGKPSPSGQPRELHLNAALPLVDPETQVGEAYVDSLRRRPRSLTGNERVLMYPANSFSQLFRWLSDSAGDFRVSLTSGHACVVALQGDMEVVSAANKKTTLKQGWSALMLPEGAPFSYSSRTAGDVVFIASSQATLTFS